MENKLAKSAKAPDFSLPRDGGGQVSLSDFKGKFLVLYFYPKDDTSGCTKEAIELNALKQDFEANECEILGVSPDSIAAHAKFKTKHNLEIVLASDETKSMLEAYGVWVEKSMYGRKYMGVERSTFLINREGVIAQAWHKVKVPGHVGAVLKALNALKSGALS